MKAKPLTFLRTATARRIRGPLLIFIALFSASAFLQYWFLSWQSSKSAREEFRGWAEEIRPQLVDSMGWSLKKIRQADWVAPGCFLYNTNGVVLDIEGFVPGVLGPVSLPDNLIYESPTTSISDFGESWRLFARKLRGGTVVMGSEQLSDDLRQLDPLLRESAQVFGSSVEEAALIRPRDIDRRLDYAVVDSFGHIRFAVGGIPLRMTDNPGYSRLEVARKVIVEGKDYIVFSTPILTGSDKLLGVMLIPRDVTAEEQMLRNSVVFNTGLAILLWMTFGGLWAIYYIREDPSRRPQPISLETALAKGEGQEIEFKAGIVDVRLASSIPAAFANTNPGCIFIGIQNNGGVSGLKRAHC